MNNMTNITVSIQIYSDLHLELINKIPKIPPKSPYLFLAGDISRFNQPSFGKFLSYCNNNWQKTFYVFGNHDYWNPISYIQQIKQDVRDFLIENKLTNIHILDNEFIHLNEDIVVFGSTFWTQSPFTTEHEATMYINDYNMILFKENDDDQLPRNLSPSYVNQMHLTDKNKVFEFLHTNEAAKDKKVIIMTHFPPQQSGTSHKKYSSQGKMMKNYFSHPDRTIEQLNNYSNILCWISGHTHYSYDFNSCEGVRLISNQMGYKTECMSGETMFKEDGLFELEY